MLLRFSVPVSCESITDSLKQDEVWDSIMLETMMYIIMPQAFKNVLPTLCNEFISLLKETSVSGYIALQDLTKGGDIIRSRTYDAFMPLIAVALIYLAMVMIFTKLVSLLERRLRNSDH